MMPATYLKLLARVNIPEEDSSVSSGASEEKGDLQWGDSYIGIFGDKIYVKNSNTLRLGFQNVGGFPTQGGKIKEDNIRMGLQKFDFDIFGMAELNIDWRMVKEQDKLPTRTKEWWEHQHVSWCHNKTFAPRQARQYGGTTLFSINKAAHRAVDKGIDASNLGRWSWTRYKGKGSHTLRVFSAYRPNPPQGPFTVYAQHNAYFHSIQREICPRQAFLVDLQEELKQALDMGDHIVLMVDGNSNMKNSDLRSSLCKLSLHEVILNKHGMKGPATHKRNSQSTPIDGIWTSQGLTIEK